MATSDGPNIASNGLVLCLDAADRNSYPGSGTTWYDLSGNNNHYTIGGNLTYSNNAFTMGTAGGAGGGATNSTQLTTSTTCTLVFWIKTNDVQAVFWGGDPDSSYGGSYYVGAYRVGNKEYYSNAGTPDYYQDLEQKANIYDYLLDNVWHMVEFKNVNFSAWNNEHNFNCYSTSYLFGSGECAKILLYNRNLTAAESLQNFNATRKRFGV